MATEALIGGPLTLLFFSYIAVYFGEFFHPRNRNMTTVFLVAGGIFVALGLAAGVGAILGFT